MKWKSSQEFLRKVSNLYNVLIAFPLLLVGFGYLEIKNANWPAMMQSTPSLVFSMLIGLAVITTYLSLRFRKESRKLGRPALLQDKMDAYLALAGFYFWACFGINMVSAIMLWLLADLGFAVVFAYVLFWLSLLRPSLTSLASLFNLEGEERRRFLNKEPLE